MIRNRSPRVGLGKFILTPIPMQRITALFSLLVLFCGISLTAQAQKTVVDIVVGSENHETLEAAVIAADLAGTLSSKGPFTVFGPTDAAFAKLPAGTLDMLLKPANKSKLAAILTYHVVAGKLMASDVVAAIQNGGGKAVVETVNGGTLTVMLEGDKVVIMDANGGKAYVTATDLSAGNGVVHVIDTVVMP